MYALSDQLVFETFFLKDIPESSPPLHLIHKFESDLIMPLCFSILLKGLTNRHINIVDEWSFCKNFLEQLATKYAKHLPYFPGLV